MKTTPSPPFIAETGLPYKKYTLIPLDGGETWLHDINETDSTLSIKFCSSLLPFNIFSKTHHYEIAVPGRITNSTLSITTGTIIMVELVNSNTIIVSTTTSVL